MRTGRSHAQFRGRPTPPSMSKAMQGTLLKLKKSISSPPDSIKTDDRHRPMSSPGVPGTTCPFPGLKNAEEGHQSLGRVGVQAWSSGSHSSPRCQARTRHSSRPASPHARCSKGLTHVTAARARGRHRQGMDEQRAGPGSPPAASHSSVPTAGSRTALSWPLLGLVKGSPERLALAACFHPH